MVDYSYAYLVWCGIFALVWLFLYWARADARREMWLLSIIITPLGPMSQYFHAQDYWRPETITATLVGPEDFIISFLIGGISAALYEYVYSGSHERRVRAGAWWYVVVAYLASTAAFVLGTLYGFTSAKVLVAVLLAAGILTVMARPHLLRHAILSSITFGSFYFVMFQVLIFLYPGIVEAWWIGDSGTALLGMPVEELGWGFLWGFVAGPASELVARLKIPAWRGLEKMGLRV